MAIVCPVDLDTLKLRAEIQSIYARVAADPSGEFHFHRGPEYAATRLGYDAAELAKVPRTVTESFAGVGNPHAIGFTHRFNCFEATSKEGTARKTA
jgi:arsenite methyltransferase